MEQLLIKNGLKHAIKKFAENGIQIKHLQFLTEADLIKLLPQMCDRAQLRSSIQHLTDNHESDEPVDQIRSGKKPKQSEGSKSHDPADQNRSGKSKSKHSKERQSDYPDNRRSPEKPKNSENHDSEEFAERELKKDQTLEMEKFVKELLPKADQTTTMNHIFQAVKDKFQTEISSDEDIMIRQLVKSHLKDHFARKTTPLTKVPKLNDSGAKIISETASHSGTDDIEKQRVIIDISDSKLLNKTVTQPESESEPEPPRSNSETDESVMSPIRVFQPKAESLNQPKQHILRKHTTTTKKVPINKTAVKRAVKKTPTEKTIVRHPGQQKRKSLNQPKQHVLRKHTITNKKVPITKTTVVRVVE